MNKKITESAFALLNEIVDYAGLFPPSALSMAEAVKNFAAYQQGEHRWMLGRFVVPVKRLDEFTENAEKFLAADKNIWRLSVLASEDIGETIARVENFNREFSGKAVCDALEIKAENAAQIEISAAEIPENFDAYFELSLNEKLGDSIQTLAKKNRRAKIRTGGITPDAFPAIEKILQFMQSCFKANVPFKCTAGLHHPVRCFKPLTYESNAPEGTMNGFLNVFLAAAFLRENLETNLVSELLKDERAENFTFDESGITWRKEHFVSTQNLKNLRTNGAISFGSCSFEEPIKDLISLEILH